MGGQKSIIVLNERIKYEGQVENVKPSGNGIIYLDNSPFIKGNFNNENIEKAQIYLKSLVYSGTLVNGQMQGKGKIETNEGIIYEGNFVQGNLVSGVIKKKQQFCFTIIDKEDKQFTGQYEFNNVLKSQKLYGNFKNGNLNGKGTYIFQNRDLYEGQFLKGDIKGQGVYINPEIFQCQGQFFNTLPNGYCTISFKNGDKYEGEMSSGQFHGEGKYIYSSGIIYQGSFYYNTSTGDCRIFYEKGQIETYKGQVSSGMYNGLGVLEYRNGLIFKGYFYENKKNGPGIYIYGKQKYKCLYIMDKMVGQLTQIMQ